MRHDSMLARERMSHKVVIGHLKEGTHGGWLVAVPAGPGAHRRQRRENFGVGPEKETVATGVRPRRQFVCQSQPFVAHLLYAEYHAARVIGDEQSQNAGQKSRP